MKLRFTLEVEVPDSVVDVLATKSEIARAVENASPDILKVDLRFESAQMEVK